MQGRESEVDLRSGAALAGVSYNRFVREVQARNVVVLAEDGFLDRLAYLASLLDDEALGAAVQRAMGQPVDGSPGIERGG